MSTLLSNIQEKCTGKKHAVRRVPPPQYAKIYGTGQQQQRKELTRSDELKNPHYESDEG
jgi:hypothetical protein